MIPETSPAIVGVRPPANRFAGSSSLGAVPAGLTVRVPEHEGAVTASRSRLRQGLRHLVSVLGDSLGLVAVAWAFPLVILAIGLPIVLLVRLVMWIVQAG